MIELNHSALEELTELKGIGYSKAHNIISFREQNGGFNNIKDLKKVKGIGPAIFKNIKDDIKVKKKVNKNKQNSGFKFVFNPDEFNLENLKEVHLVGEMNNWDPADKSYSLNKNENGNWVNTFNLDQGIEYKILYDCEDWETGNEIGGPYGENLEV